MRRILSIFSYLIFERFRGYLIHAFSVLAPASQQHHQPQQLVLLLQRQYRRTAEQRRTVLGESTYAGIPPFPLSCRLMVSSDVTTEFSSSYSSSSSFQANLEALPMAENQGKLRMFMKRMEDNSTAWNIYERLIRHVMVEDRVLYRKRKGFVSSGEVTSHHLNSTLIRAVQEYLLCNAQLLQKGEQLEPTILLQDPSMEHANCEKSNDSSTMTVMTISAKAANTTTDTLNQAKDVRRLLKEQRNRFARVSGLTEPQQFEYCTLCLSYLGDVCAKKSCSEAAKIGWYKIREMGIIPRENCLSTFMYALSLSPTSSLSTIDTLLEVASLHGQLYEPNEKTLTLRIKTLVARGDARSAESILFDWPNLKKKQMDRKQATTKSSTSRTALSGGADGWERLRTFLPILTHYCEQGEVASILRLYHRMRYSNGVHLDDDTYALIISSLARYGCFLPQRLNPTGDLTNSTNDSHGEDEAVQYGPHFLDELCTNMAEDLLELREAAVLRLWDSSNLSFASHSSLSRVDPIGRSMRRESNLQMDRVSISNVTGICRTTGTQLRLFALTPSQRHHVHDALLEMASAQQRDFEHKLKSQGKVLKDDLNGSNATEELLKFSMWLERRQEEPFTVFVDGPNVGFYGHGSIHYSQIKAVVEELERRGENPLVIMPSKYIEKTFWLMSMGRFQVLNEQDLKTMSELLDRGRMYSTPAACLDDYYWMIASVAHQSMSRTFKLADGISDRLPGLRPLLVTNDQMRDHRTSLLNPREFRRWTSCHIVQYDVARYNRNEWESRRVTFFPADVFSREIQGNPHPTLNGSMVWHFPVTEWAEPDRFYIFIPEF